MGKGRAATAADRIASYWFISGLKVGKVSEPGYEEDGQITFAGVPAAHIQVGGDYFVAGVKIPHSTSLHLARRASRLIPQWRT